jgi:DNA processing protein
VSNEISKLHPGELGYPEGLLDLEDPPSVYLTGPLAPSPAVAVVGTRRCTRYGSDLAVAFGWALAKSGWTVVSGLARGIDASAHRGTLDADGFALAVLGAGVDVWYPAENRPLYRRLLASGGVLMSEYPPGTRPDRWRFPARNRLIAAAASATVVVEAGETGGALITARLSAEMGRPVLVVPGDVDRPASVGCNRLIRDGAFPVLGSDDLIEELSLLLGAPPRHSAENDGSLPVDGLDIDDLPGHWSCSIPEALARLGRLELEGEVRRVGDRVFPCESGD